MAGWFDLDLLARVGAVPGALADSADALIRLPGQLAALIKALEHTTAALDRVLPELTRALAAMEQRLEHVDGLASDLALELTRTAATLERALPEVSGAIGTMDGRIRNLDATLSDLGKLVFGLVDVIPGARRMLRRSEPPAG